MSAVNGGVSAHFEIVQTDHEQPWHVRLVGANGEILSSSEPLSSFDAARTNMLAQAGAFIVAPDLRGNYRSDDGEWFVSEGGLPSARVRYVDLRTSP